MFFSSRAGVNTKRTAGKLVFVPKYGILEVLKSSVQCKLILSFGIIPNLATDFFFIRPSKHLNKPLELEQVKEPRAKLGYIPCFGIAVPLLKIIAI